MNRMFRLLVMVVALVVFTFPLSAVQSAVSAEPNPAALYPWRIETVISDIQTNTVTVAYGGSNHYPLITYVNASTGYTRLIVPAVYMSGNCGSGNRWYCWYLSEGYVQAWSASPMAVYNFQDSFKIGWVYHNTGTNKFVLQEREYKNDLEPLSTTITTVLDPTIYNNPEENWALIGVPSLVFDAYGNARVAMVLGFGGLRKLVYAYEKTSGDPDPACNNETGTKFQCDMILDVDYILSPVYHMVMTASNSPRILYYSMEDNVGKLMYAYPYSSLLFPHTNCGPENSSGNPTWRCIVMLNSSGTWNLGGTSELPKFEMAIAPGNQYPRMAVKAKSSSDANYVLDIEYVGSDGNCGSDWNLNTFTNRWQCDGRIIDSRPTYPYMSFDIAVDAFDYPLIAVGHAHYLDWIHLWLTYPQDRLAGHTGVWTWEELDGRDIDTAYATDFTLSDTGLGLIGYIEKEDYNNKLKIAYQEKISASLPIIIR